MTTTYIIPAGNLVAVRAKLAAGASDETKNLAGIVVMFSTPMSASGNLPATHYVSSGNLSQAESDFLDANLPKPFQGNEEGEDAFGMFDRVGLKIITPAGV